MTTRKPVNEKTLDGTLAVRDGRRHINLNQGEREALLRQRTIEQAVVLFLDLENDRSWAQIAAELDMSVSSLKRLTQSSDFILVYEDALAAVGHDPRLQAVTASLGDLLPAARRRLQTLITNTGTADGVALKAIEKIFEWTGVDSAQELDSPDALKNFLSTHGVTVQGDLNVMQLNIPDEYKAAFDRYLGGGRDTIEGVARTEDNMPSLETNDEAEEKSPVDVQPVQEVQPEQ